MRRRVVVQGAVALLLSLAAAWWFWWVPGWRPPLEPGERYGIDVSAHQGPIDWERVAADGIEFAYVKATEGGDFVDERFAANWEGASAAGLDRGAYHFFTLCTPGDVQARHFLAVAEPDPDALAPAVDLEMAGNCRARPSRHAVETELGRFLLLVETAWRAETVLYVGEDWDERYPGREELGRPLWLRRFLVRPSEDWTIWQLHGYARVDGIEGGVDLDVMRPFDSLESTAFRLSRHRTRGWVKGRRSRRDASAAARRALDAAAPVLDGGAVKQEGPDEERTG